MEGLWPRAVALCHWRNLYNFTGFTRTHNTIVEDVMSSASLVLCVCVFFFKQIHIKNNLKTIFIPWSDKQSVESFGLGEIGSL